MRQPESRRMYYFPRNHRGKNRRDRSVPVILFMIIAFILSACAQDKTGLNNPIVINAIDSICKFCEPIRHSPHERVKLDECYLMDPRNERNKQWVYGDSIDKYCGIEDLKALASSHSSLAVRYVAFQLLLKRDSHEAVRLLIDDINNNDSIIATHIDQGFPEAISSLRVSLTQNNRKKYNVSIEDSIAVDNAVLNSKIKSEIHYFIYGPLKKIRIDTGSGDGFNQGDTKKEKSGTLNDPL